MGLHTRYKIYNVSIGLHIEHSEILDLRANLTYFPSTTKQSDLYEYYKELVQNEFNFTIPPAAPANNYNLDEGTDYYTIKLFEKIGEVG